MSKHLAHIWVGLADVVLDMHSEAADQARASTFEHQARLNCTALFVAAVLTRVGTVQQAGLVIMVEVITSG